MNRTQRKRLQNMAQRIGAIPIPPEVEDDAYQHFKETGELPEVEKLAMACIDRALNYGHPLRNGVRTLDIRETHRVLDRLGQQPEREPGWHPPRKLLFFEAVHGWEAVRVAARSVIEMLVAIEQDVEDPDFVDEDMELPDWGSVGMHLLGFPECLVRPPYKRQADRLFRRMHDLRQRVDQDDREWMDAYGEAAIRFLHEGELPGDELMVEAALANGEFMGLVAHYLGVHNAEAMGAYDRAARGTGAEWAKAIETLQAMGAERTLLPDDVPGRPGGDE